MVVARAHAGDYGVDLRPPCAGLAFPLDDDHSPAFAEDHPVSFSIEGAGGLVSGSLASRLPEECPNGGEFQKMQVGEIILGPSDNSGVDDAIWDHLHGAVKCDQRGRAGSGDRITGPHEPIPVADEAGRCTVESA